MGFLEIDKEIALLMIVFPPGNKFFGEDTKNPNKDITEVGVKC